MPPKGRKPKPKDKVRDRLIDLARELFAKYGYNKTIINDIALAGSLGKSSLYYYFSGKDDIFKAVLESELNDLQKCIVTEVNLAPDPLSKIKAYVLTRIKLMSNYKNLYSVIRELPTSRHSYTEIIRQKFDLMEIQLITTILNDGVSEGFFKINEPEFAAQGVIGALRGIQFQIFTPEKKPGFEKTLDNLLEILMFGLIK